MSTAATGGVLAALELTELAEDLLRQRLRRERPEITEAEVEAAVRRWYDRRPGAELGDSVGRPRRVRVA